LHNVVAQNNKFEVSTWTAEHVIKVVLSHIHQYKFLVCRG